MYIEILKLPSGTVQRHSTINEVSKVKNTMNSATQEIEDLAAEALASK
jgi:hypothetical protein